MKLRRDIISFVLAAVFAFAPIFGAVHALDHDNATVKSLDDFSLTSDTPTCELCDLFQSEHFYSEQKTFSVPHILSSPTDAEQVNNQYQYKYTNLLLRGPPVM